MRAMMILATAAALSACATLPRGAPVDTGTPRVIAYESSACFGACPTYALTLDTATGAGTFEGKRFTGVTGRRAFTATPAQALAFSATVDEVRRSPAGAFEPGGALCANQATDMAGVTVSWSGGGAVAVERHVYFGCDMAANRALFERLRHAPDALPIAGFIARR